MSTYSVKGTTTKKGHTRSGHTRRYKFGVPEKHFVRMHKIRYQMARRFKPKFD